MLGINNIPFQVEYVTILILIDGFLQYWSCLHSASLTNVTILILIDGFLQLNIFFRRNNDGKSHNPYFNRWFSAIGGMRMEKRKIATSQSLF